MNDDEKTPRGRPRPKETVRRDAHILSLLSGAPRSRKQLVHLTGLTPVQVYLSLDRLRKGGEVTIVGGSKPHLLWGKAYPSDEQARTA